MENLSGAKGQKPAKYVHYAPSEGESKAKYIIFEGGLTNYRHFCLGYATLPSFNRLKARVKTGSFTLKIPLVKIYRSV